MTAASASTQTARLNLETLAHHVRPWLTRQRWFPSTAKNLEFVGAERFPTLSDDTAGWDMYFTLEPGRLLRAPLVCQKAAHQDHICILPDGWTVLDASESPSFHDHLWQGLVHIGPAPTRTGPAAVLQVEQTNTSLLFPTSDGATVVKMLRVLEAGEHPEVDLGSRLRRSSPTLAAKLTAIGPAPAYAHRLLSNDQVCAILATEYLPDAKSAWDVACSVAATGQDFTEVAHQLGQLTSQLHQQLSRIPCPINSQHRYGRRAYAAQQAVAQVMDSCPPLTAVVPALETYHRLIPDIVANYPSPPLQRIHGDFHLGQILQLPDGQWRVVDFEGEPSKPLTDRGLAGTPLRDVAGMVRSFDYVARSSGASSLWAERTIEAFLDGYEVSYQSEPTLLIEVIDKALYELRYELTHRPTWATYPAAALHDLMLQLPELLPDSLGFES